MRKLVFILLALSFIFHSCNDGDIILFELDFDEILELCGDENIVDVEDLENLNSYVIYDTREDPYESLILLFPRSTSNDLIFNPTSSPYENSFNINTTNVRFNYRIYDGDPLAFICQEIPSSSVTIIEDYEAISGNVTTTSTFTDDDNDGIPSLLEDINGNGDLEDDDTDGDGIPNYKDDDDDGDNVPTVKENPDPNGDGNLDDAQNTDSASGDTVPDYLDEDDDGDGVITRYEDENSNGNLFDDLAPLSIIQRFLDNTATDTFINDTFNKNIFIRTVTVKFIVENVNIEILNTDIINLGTYTGVLKFEN